MKKEYLLVIQTALAAMSAYISNKLGLLYPVLVLLSGMMVLDYITGMLASKKEALEYPDDVSKGLSSKKGRIGIFKKIGYMVAIAAAMAVDFLIFRVTEQLGITVPAGTFFGLLTSVWFILNELLSLVENAGRMGAPVPSFLSNIIMVLKKSVEQNGDQSI